MNNKTYDHIDQLTMREHEVLRLISQGLSNDEIGQQLGIATQTVKNHVVNILAKLGVRNRVSAVVIAIQQGVVDVSELEVSREVAYE